MHERFNMSPETNFTFIGKTEWLKKNRLYIAYRTILLLSVCVCYFLLNDSTNHGNIKWIWNAFVCRDRIKDDYIYDRFLVRLCYSIRIKPQCVAIFIGQSEFFWDFICINNGILLQYNVAIHFCVFDRKISTHISYLPWNWFYSTFLHSYRIELIEILFFLLYFSNSESAYTRTTSNPTKSPSK